MVSLCDCLLIAGCTTLSREIQKNANLPTDSYPAAIAANPELQKTPIINLKQYKSVQSRPNQRSDVAIALAASGGGYRAANLTLGVLMGLEQIHSAKLKGNLLQEVDYISTVSGSGFGVGYYFDKLYHYLQNSHGNGVFSLNATVNNMLTEKTENPLRTDLAEDLFFGKQRGLKLEKKLNDAIFSTTKGDLTFDDIFVPVGSQEPVKLPFWAINSTVFQNAAIFPFTPDILARYKVTGYFHDGLRYYVQEDFNNPWYISVMPVSVGVTASASVPFVTPATTLITKGCKKQCYLQMFDGGLSDNLGVYTALSLLLQDHSKTKVLIILDAYKGNAQPYSAKLLPPGGFSLLWRVATVSTDANRAHILPNAKFVARGLLCEKGAKNVIVVYLSLQGYPRAQKIGTKLVMSAENQKYLIKVGQELILHDEVLKRFITELENNNLRFGRCQKG